MKKKNLADEPAMKKLKELYKGENTGRVNEYLKSKGADKMKDPNIRAKEIIELPDLTLYSVKALSEKLNISKDTIKEYIKNKKFTAKKLAGKWYISSEALKAYFTE